MTYFGHRDDVVTAVMSLLRDAFEFAEQVHVLLQVDDLGIDLRSENDVFLKLGFQLRRSSLVSSSTCRVAKRVVSTQAVAGSEYRAGTMHDRASV